MTSVHSVLLVLLCSLASAHPPFQAQTTVGKFWQITDIHWDKAYNVSGDVTNWCHLNVTSQPAGSGDNGYYGNYSCDAPWVTVKSAVGQMASVEAKPNFILWTGDNAPHWDRGPDFKYIFSVLNELTQLLQDTFPGVPILPCTGNHDTNPPDQYPGENKTFYTRYLTEGGWSRLLTAQAQKTFITAGYYSQKINNDLTVVMLNTNLYYRPNKAISPKEPDAGSQLAWLRSQLKNARTEGYRVVLGSHIAPGYFERATDDTFMYGSYNDALIGVLNEYYDVILTQVYGHEHTDSFRILSDMVDGELQLRSALFLAPSVTPWVPGAGTNPGVRLYTYTPNTLQDYTQYVLNLTESNSAGQPLWSRLYSAADTYSLTSLSVESMSDLYSRLFKDKSLFDTYYRLNTGGFVAPPCGMACKRSQLCAIAHLTESGMSRCLNSVITMDSILSGEMLTHGPAAGVGTGDSGAACCPASDHQYWAMVVGVVAAVGFLCALVALAVVRLRKRAPLPPPGHVLRNVTSLVPGSGQGYETMT